MQAHTWHALLAHCDWCCLQQNDQMLSDIQILVHGIFVQLCDDGHHTAQHDCSYCQVVNKCIWTPCSCWLLWWCQCCSSTVECYLICWTLFTQHAITWVLHAVLLGIIPHICWPDNACVYIHGHAVWSYDLAPRWSSRHAVCLIQACPHQNDGYNINTCRALRVQTSYYTGCTATHSTQLQAKAYACILQCWQAHQKQSLAVWRSHYQVSAHKIGTTVVLAACLHAFVR